MSRYSKVAVALDQYDYDNMQDLIHKTCETDLVRCLETPDNTYQIIYWDDVVWEDNVREFMSSLEKVRHAFISISEDGEIWQDIETDDARGCDGEFQEILSWTADICLWDDQGPLAPEKEYVPISRDRIIELFKAYIMADFEATETGYIYDALCSAGCDHAEIKALGLEFCIPEEV